MAVERELSRMPFTKSAVSLLYLPANQSAPSGYVLLGAIVQDITTVSGPVQYVTIKAYQKQ